LSGFFIEQGHAMSIADELHKLQELHQSGALTDAEFAQAKARVLAGRTSASEPDEKEADLRDQLAELKRDSELDRLDREWDQERQRYLIYGRYGAQPYTPSKMMSVIMGAAIVGFGILWTAFAASITGGVGGPASIFPCFGVVFILVGIGVSAYNFTRASQYEQAYQRYQRRRALLLGGDDAQPRNETERRPSTAIEDAGEPTRCLRCGRTIPAGETQCPNCGLSVI
jgi:hypothetical protein